MYINMYLQTLAILVFYTFQWLGEFIANNFCVPSLTVDFNCWVLMSCVHLTDVR